MLASDDNQNHEETYVKQIYSAATTFHDGVETADTGTSASTFDCARRYTSVQINLSQSNYVNVKSDNVEDLFNEINGTHYSVLPGYTISNLVRIEIC